MAILSHRNVITQQPSPIFKISSPADNHLLQYDATSEAFVNSSHVESTTAINLGGGSGIFLSKVSDDIQLKSLVGGTFISLTNDTNTITINSDISSLAASGVSLGSGAAVYKSTSNGVLSLRSLTFAGVLDASVTDTEIQINSSAEANTGANMGTSPDGYSMYNGMSGTALEFKRLNGGTNINLVSGTNNLTVDLDCSFASSTAGQLVQTNSSSVLTALAIGNANAGLTTNGTSAAWSVGAMAQAYQFKVNYDGSGNVSATDNMPTGWSRTISGNVITITHTHGSAPRVITYLGYDSSTQEFKYRYPTGAYEMTVPEGTSTTQFKIQVNSSVTGSDTSGYALANVIF
jgi:hypothetical protein